MAQKFDRIYVCLSRVRIFPMRLAALWLFIIWASLPVHPVNADDPLRTVIIDPGHGGHDRGVLGAGGGIEKEISLKFARLVASRLESAYRLVMTRTGDYQLELTRRVSIANQQKGDLFISIHIGGAPRYHVNGWGLYVYGRQDDNSIRRPYPPGPRDEGCCLYWDAMQQRHQKKSLGFAQALRSEFKEDSRIPGIEISKAPIRLLEGLDMPAAVIEAGYLTNPQAEIRLNDEAYLNDMADHVREAVDAFFQAENPQSQSEK